MAKNAQSVTEKWSRHATGAQTDYVNGVTAVTEAPGAAAAKQSQKAMANYAEAVQSGRWAKRTAGVTLEEWKDKTLNLGASRYTTGINAGVPKMQKFLTDFLPVQENIAARVRAMPSATLEDNIARSAAMIRETAKYKNR